MNVLAGLVVALTLLALTAAAIAALRGHRVRATDDVRLVMHLPGGDLEMNGHDFETLARAAKAFEAADVAADDALLEQLRHDEPVDDLGDDVIRMLAAWRDDARP